MPTPLAKSPASNRIVETDRKINDLEKAIDDDCAHIIAKRQPAASDLRLVLGISKIVTDLERAGDEAKKIAKGVRRIYEAGHAVAVRCRHPSYLPKPRWPWSVRRSTPSPGWTASVALAVIQTDNDVDTNSSPSSAS